VIVVADASPLRYLVWIEEVQLIPTVYGAAWIPPAVFRELSQPQTPARVRQWIAKPPSWLQIRAPSHAPHEFARTLGPGECEAIALAEEVHADFLLIDDWAGRQEAERRHLTIQGTLGLLRFAAQNGLTDLPNVLAKLRETSFRASDELIQSMLDEDARRRR
jgi:predicted nucleic acid-binding protein